MHPTRLSVPYFSVIKAIGIGLVAYAACLFASPLHSAHAADEAARTAITAALTQWTDDFNAGRADKVCDLFARDLRADFRGQPERGYEAQCELLRHSLADQARDSAAWATCSLDSVHSVACASYRSIFNQGPSRQIPGKQAATTDSRAKKHFDLLLMHRRVVTMRTRTLAMSARLGSL